MTSASADALRAVPDDPHLGEILGGRYRVVERLGEGGMGAVYRGEHLDLQRAVAIKMLAPELSKKRVAVERFQREARTASRLGHPNIIDVFDMGRAQDGTPYLVMQLLEGHDLEAELTACGGVLAPARVVEVLGPIANALDTCHAQGVIHRDLKPSNVFLAKLGDGTVSPKLVDFGLAMLAASDARLTKSGFLAGTPHYLPPEAVHGDLPGAPGDVYALATMAYEAICGALPFDAEQPSGVLVQKVTLPAPPMGEVAAGSFPADVEAVLARALDRDPARRHPTAAAFVSALADAIAGRTVAWGPDRAAPPKPRLTYRERMVGPSGPASSVRESALRRVIAPSPWPRIALAIAAVGLVALLSVGAWWWQASPPAPPEPEGDVAEAGAVADVADPAPIAEAEPVAPSPFEPVAPPEAEPLVAERAPPEPEPPVAERTPRPDRARPIVADAPREAPVRDREEAERLVQSAGSLLVRGDLDAATSMLERARTADPTYAATYRSLGLAHQRAHRDAQARTNYERYLRLAPGASDAERIRARIVELGG